MSLLGFLTRQYFPEDAEEEREPITQAVQRSDTYQYIGRKLGDLTRPDGVDRRGQRQASRRSSNAPMRSEDPVYQGAEVNLPRRLRQEAQAGGTSLSDIDLAQRDRVRGAVQERRNRNFLSQFELPESPAMRQRRFIEENPGDPLAQVPQTPTPLPNDLFRRDLEPDSYLADTPELAESRRVARARRDYDAMVNNPLNQGPDKLGRRTQSFEDYLEDYGGVNRGGGRNIDGYARYKMEDGKAYYLTDVGDPSSWSEIDVSIYDEAERLTRKMLGPDADMDTYFRED